MKRVILPLWRNFILICWFFFIILSCKKTTEISLSLLAPPAFVSSSVDTAVVEKGIDAIPEKDAIFLEWYQSLKQDVYYYRIHRSQLAKENFKHIASIPFPETTYVDQKVQIGIKYYYFVTAIDQKGNESLPSDTVNYKLLEKPFNLSNTSETLPLLRWQFHSPSPLKYLIKFFENKTDKKMWTAYVNPGFSGQTEEVRFNFDHTAVVDSLCRGVTYRWRVDAVGGEQNCGSESNWRVSTVQ